MPTDGVRAFDLNEVRCRRLIDRAIARFALDLTGLSVLTEAASGSYVLTPLIAALAGAQGVLALTADSRYGRAADVESQTMLLARRWGVADRVRVSRSRSDSAVSQADIVTNLGFVRPLGARLLARLKPTAVIPLMWETWEYREEDLDLAECRRLGIPVLGTNEHHLALRTFEYIGHLALKLLFRLEIEVFASTVAVIGTGEFAAQTVRRLRAAGAEVTLLDPQAAGGLSSQRAREALQGADALVVVEPHSRRALIGPDGDLNAGELAALNPALAVAHICGGVDRASLDAAGLPCCPGTFAPPGHMSVATDYLGPRPLVDLHAAGLKVGERLARARARGLAGPEAEAAVLGETTLALGVPDDYDRRALLVG